MFETKGFSVVFKGFLWFSRVFYGFKEVFYGFKGISMVFRDFFFEMLILFCFGLGCSFRV